MDSVSQFYRKSLRQAEADSPCPQHCCCWEGKRTDEEPAYTTLEIPDLVPAKPPISNRPRNRVRSRYCPLALFRHPCTS